MRILILANPTAGAGAGRVNRQRLIEVARRDLERQHEVEVQTAPSSEGITDLAEDAAQSEDFDVVVAAGGDGTVNAVINGLMKADENLRPALGVLPMGTGNVFAFNMGIARSWREACRIISNGHTRSVDVGFARAENIERYFLCMAGVGFDAKVIEDTTLRLKFVLRDFAYVLKTLQNVVLHQGTEVTLKFPDGEYSNEAWLVMIGNAASYAWDIKVTQHAQLDDGLLDVCLMPWHNKLVSIQQALQILTGQHIERGIAQYWQAESLKIESEPPVPVQLDGDEFSRTPLEICVKTHAIRVLSPKAE